MSRSLGVLTLDLIARTGNFDQGMDRASRRVRTTANEMEAAKRAADRMVAGIAAAAAGFATAAAAMAVSSAKALDATSKMAQQIGTTTESLTGMRFAAQQFANISDQQFDMSMRRMTRRIAEAAEGGGSAKKALEAMGLSARELARLSPDKQMLAIADAMQKTEHQADRLRYAMALFDTEGMALVPALQKGAAAFEANIALARQFGVVVSQEAASAAEEFMINMNLLTEAQKGFKNQVAESVLPMLAEFSGHLVDIAKNAGDMGERVETALKVIGVAAAATATIITSRLVAAILAKVGAWGAAAFAAARLQAQMTSLSAAIVGASRAVSASAGLAAGAATVLGRAGQLALGVLGGPVGLAATAVITGAAFLAMGRDSRTAATDVDELTQSLENLNRRQLESAAFHLENELVELSKEAEGHGQILRGLRNDYDALYGAQGVTEDGLRNVRQAIREEEEAFESVIATIAKKSPLLAQITQRLWDLDTASRGAAGGVDTLNQAMGFSEADERFLAQIQGRIKALQDAGDPIKIVNRIIAENKDLTEAGKVALISAAHAEKALIAARDAAAKATKSGTNTLNEAKRAAEAFRREQDQGLRAQLQAVSAIHQQAGALEDQVLLFGQGKTALEDLTIARLEEQAAMLRGFDGSQEQVEAIERETEARQRLRTAIGSLEQKEAERQAWEDWARDVEQIFDRVGQSLTDAIFDGGKSAKDLLRDLFKGLTFNVLINPVMNQLQGWVTNQLGGMFGYQNPQQQSGGGFSFGGGGTFGAGGVEMAGDWLLRSGLAPETGAKMLMQADSIANTASSILGYGKAVFDLAEGRYGSAAGTAIGTYIMPGPGTVVGSVVGGLLDGIFGDDEPTTRRSQRGASHMLPDGSFEVAEWDDRQTEVSQQAARDFAEQAVKSANDLFARAGVDAAIVGFSTLMESSILGDKQGVGSSGYLQIGDDVRLVGLDYTQSSWTRDGFGGWSDADMLPRLQTDIQLTLLEAFQGAGDAMPNVLATMLEDVDIRSLGAEQAQALAQSFQMVIDEVSAFQVAVESLPFATLRDLSFDAAANLIQFAGGLEALDQGMTTYFQNFYSETEQLDWLSSQISTSLSELGLAMPDVTQGAEAAKSAYRELVESLNLTTEEGQRAYATMMTLSGGFAELVTGLDELASSTAEYDRLVRAADAQMNAAVGQLQTAWSAVQRFAQQEIERLQQTFSATDSAMQAYQSRVRSIESDLGNLITTIGRGVDSLRGQVNATARLQYDQARAVISTALLTGQLPQTADLTEAMRIAQQGVSGGRYASAFDQRAAYLTLANELEALQDIAKPELDTARASLEQLERQYNALRGIAGIGDASLTELQKQLSAALQTEASARTQIAAIEGQLNWAERQYNALMGIDSGITDLASAMRAFGAASRAVEIAQANPVSRDQRYYEAKLDQLQRTGSTHGGIDWTTASVSDLAAYFRSEGLTPEEHYRRFGRYEGLSYDVGTSYVPRDMLANVHRGEIIIDPRTSDSLRRYGIEVHGGGSSRATEQLLREQLSEVRQQNRYLYEIVKSGKRTQNYTEDTARALQSDSDDLVLVF